MLLESYGEIDSLSHAKRRWPLSHCQNTLKSICLSGEFKAIFIQLNVFTLIKFLEPEGSLPSGHSLYYVRTVIVLHIPTNKLTFELLILLQGILYYIFNFQLSGRM
jgi:hypothetical protein